MTITPTYITVGTINNITPQMQWETDEAIAMQVIVASILNSAFMNIKGKPNTQEVWDTLKALYKGQTMMVLVKLSQQLQSTHCREEDNVCKYFDKLANLCEQLAAMGKTVPETEYASILMGLLPMSYMGMLGSIAASAEISRAAVSPAVVIKLATDKFDHHNLQSDKAQDKAFATQLLALLPPSSLCLLCPRIPTLSPMLVTSV
jgi:gag-polypeptide of LTR copia-type